MAMRKKYSKRKKSNISKFEKHKGKMNLKTLKPGGNGQIYKTPKDPQYGQHGTGTGETSNKLRLEDELGEAFLTQGSNTASTITNSAAIGTAAGTVTVTA